MSLSRHQFSFVSGDDTVCVNTTANTLDDVIARFEDYLRGCGYTFPPDHVLDFVPKLTPDLPVAPADLEPSEDGKEGV